jgi:Tfp pilus assembly protein PilX
MPSICTDQRGIALPMAVLTLLILTALTLGFVGLATTEPSLANNQARTNQALALAEAGVQNAIWALNNPADPLGIPSLAAVPARYNSPLPHSTGATFIAYGSGGYTITVTQVAGTTNQAQVTVTGWTPAITGFKSKAIVQTTVFSWNGRFNPPAAVTAVGEIQFGGHASADGTTSTCGPKYGTFSLGSATFGGSSGASGTPAGSDPNQPMSAFAALTLSQSEINLLKKAAQANGTYYQGNVGFNPIPNGLVFVDTVSGNPIGSPPNLSDLANVTVNGANSNGWMIVMGSVTMHGNISYTGFIYAADLFDYQGTGHGGISGAVESFHVSNPVATTVDVDDLGNSGISFNCNALIPPSGLGQSYTILPGTWKVLAG